jgi:hypothetical protein
VGFCLSTQVRNRRLKMKERDECNNARHNNR